MKKNPRAGLTHTKSGKNYAFHMLWKWVHHPNITWELASRPVKYAAGGKAPHSALARALGLPRLLKEHYSLRPYKERAANLQTMENCLQNEDSGKPGHTCRTPGHMCSTKRLWTCVPQNTCERPLTSRCHMWLVCLLGPIKRFLHPIPKSEQCLLAERK